MILRHITCYTNKKLVHIAKNKFLFCLINSKGVKKADYVMCGAI